MFAYLDDLGRHSEWQEQLVSAEKQGDGPTRVGTKSIERRRMGKREQTISYEVTEHDPPRVFAFHGINGPARAIGLRASSGGSRDRGRSDEHEGRVASAGELDE